MNHEESINSNECHCDCHVYGGSMDHSTPCCVQCPHCGKRVISLNLHVREAHRGKVLSDLRGKPDSFSLGDH